MGALLGTLTRFIGTSARAKGGIDAIGHGFASLARKALGIGELFLGLGKIIAGPFISAFTDMLGFFTQGIKDALGMELSIGGLLKAAEEARKFFSELADELNFYSSATGSTANAMNILTSATATSKAGLQTLKGAFESMVNTGADTDDFIKGMLSDLGDFEVKTGVAASQFGMFSTKLQQTFNEKKGITKDIKAMTKAIIGTGLKGAQLEQTLTGLTEVTEKLAFATRGDTMDMKALATEYSKTTAVFKAFGISAQTTTTFLNGMLDPENVEKNMMLMAKLGISYGEFNDMLNSGKGQDKFFDKILSNIGDVAREANMIEDASTRYKYLKDTLGLPPEIANKLMKVTPNKMRSELKKIKQEMDEAEKKDKWRKELKAREEKYEEQMRFLRMQMVAPLMDIIQKNRGTVQKFVKAIGPIIKGIASLISKALTPFNDWLDAFATGLDKLTNGGANADTMINFALDSLKPLWESIKKSISDVWNSPQVQGAVIPFINSIGKFMKAAIQSALSGIPGFGPEKTLEQALDDLNEQELKQKKKNIEELESERAAMVKRELLKISKAEGRGELSNFIAKDMFSKVKMGEDGKLDQVELTNTILKYAHDNNLSTATKDDLFNKIYGPGGFAEKYEEEFVKTSELANKVIATQGLKSFKQVAKEDKNIKENVKSQEELDAMLKKMRQGGEQMSGFGGTQTNYKPPAEATRTKIEKAQKASPEELKSLAQEMLKDKAFMEYVSKGLVAQKDLRIKELQTSLENNKSKLDAVSSDYDKLTKQFEDFKKESTENTAVGILKTIRDGWFGAEQDSVKNILLSIEGAIVEETLITKNNMKKQNTSGSLGVKASELSAIDANRSGTLVGNSLLNVAGSGGIKNIQVKQTMFLKAIAESSVDSATVLKYIGRNLVFTPTGLATNNSIGPGTTFKRYGLLGQELGVSGNNNSGNIYGLGIIQ